MSDHFRDVVVPLSLMILATLVVLSVIVHNITAL